MKSLRSRIYWEEGFGENGDGVAATGEVWLLCLEVGLGVVRLLAELCNRAYFLQKP